MSLNRGKGIILAGGSGSRLYPITSGVSKQLLPIYDKPLIYYPISTLMDMGISEILIICKSEDLPQFKRAIGHGENFGATISYAVQDNPNGIAEAFIIGEDFIGKDNVTLILGDNIYYSPNINRIKPFKDDVKSKARVFGCQVHDPERYGVGVFDDDCNLLAIEEKPENPKSDIAITGLYQYTNDVVNFAKCLKPSARGELEITDINNIYIEMGNVEIAVLGGGTAWLDAGTVSSLHDAASFVKTIQDRQGIKFGCPESIGLKKRWITKTDMTKYLEDKPNIEYYNYLRTIINKKGRSCAQFLS
jgi:glucose-1-phosphate thymidylyltransferase